MPNAVIKSYAEKIGKSVEHVEAWWDEAKEQASKKFKKKDKHFWAYVNGIVKRRAGLSEETTFKDFILLCEATGDEAFDKMIKLTLAKKSVLNKKERDAESIRIAEDKEPLDPTTARTKRIESLLNGLGIKRVRSEFMSELDNESRWHLVNGIQLHIANGGRTAYIMFNGPAPDIAGGFGAESEIGWWQAPSRNESEFALRHRGLKKLSNKDKFKLSDVEDLDAFDAWVETWMDAIRHDGGHTKNLGKK